MAGVVLAVDAGGTVVRMGLFGCAEGRLDPLVISRYASAGWPGLERDLRTFLVRPEVSVAMEMAGGRAAVFALAGPTSGESEAGSRTGSVTRWGPAIFREVEPLLRPFPFDRCILLNDMEAANYAAADAPEESLRPLDGNACPPSQNRFVHLRPGTGLGVGLFSEGRSLPSEGGSAPCSFDADDPDELAMARHLRSLSGSPLPTYEAALCGDGLRAMCEALTGRGTAPEVLTGEWGRSDRSMRVVGLFVRLLARAAQGVSLILQPEACFLSGAIVDALPDGAWESFCGSFRNHATQGLLLGRVRLALVSEPELALRGAALVGARALEYR